MNSNLLASMAAPRAHASHLRLESPVNCTAHLHGDGLLEILNRQSIHSVGATVGRDETEQTHAQSLTQPRQPSTALDSPRQPQAAPDAHCRPPVQPLPLAPPLPPCRSLARGRFEAVAGLGVGLSFGKSCRGNGRWRGAWRSCRSTCSPEAPTAWPGSAGPSASWTGER